jgi:hypothetical protein
MLCQCKNPIFTDGYHKRQGSFVGEMAEKYQYIEEKNQQKVKK